MKQVWVCIRWLLGFLLKTLIGGVALALHVIISVISLVMILAFCFGLFVMVSGRASPQDQLLMLGNIVGLVALAVIDRFICRAYGVTGIWYEGGGRRIEVAAKSGFDYDEKMDRIDKEYWDDIKTKEIERDKREREQDFYTRAREKEEAREAERQARQDRDRFGD